MSFFSYYSFEMICNHFNIPNYCIFNTKSYLLILNHLVSTSIPIIIPFPCTNAVIIIVAVVSTTASTTPIIIHPHTGIAPIVANTFKIRYCLPNQFKTSSTSGI